MKNDSFFTLDIFVLTSNGVWHCIVISSEIHSDCKLLHKDSATLLVAAYAEYSGSEGNCDDPLPIQSIAPFFLKAKLKPSVKKKKKAKLPFFHFSIYHVCH